MYGKRFPLFLMARPKYAQQSAKVYLEIPGEWTIKVENRVDSSFTLSCGADPTIVDNGNRRTLVDTLTVQAPCYVQVEFLHRGTEAAISVYAEYQTNAS